MISYKNRPEKSFDIPLRDGKKLHAILRGVLTDSTPLIVMMHGRPGSANEVLQYLGARFFNERGIATLRLSMYDFGLDYRSILDCTIETHIEDFEDVIDYLRTEGAGQVFALGHSYGGMTILGSQAKLEGAVLWDPSHGLAYFNGNPDFESDDYPEETYGNIVVGTGGHGSISSKEQADYDKALGDNSDWAKDKGYPLKFILAGAGPLAQLAEKYYKAASEPKAVVNIEDAHHQFLDSDEVTEKLFTETVEWIEAHHSLL